MASKRKPSARLPNPPAWEVPGHPYHGLRHNPSAAEGLRTLRCKHSETTAKFREFAAKAQWPRIHSMHYDWWMFPLERNTKPGTGIYDVLPADIEELKADPTFMAEYREGVRLAALAWGWEVDHAKPVLPLQNGMGWSNWDIRLAKILRSLWLFEDGPYFASMQAYARLLKPHGGFTHKGRDLDEVLLMTLPRRAQRYYSPAEAASAVKAGVQMPSLAPKVTCPA
eukprot:RCo036712